MSKFDYLEDIFSNYLIENPSKHRCSKCGRIYDGKKVDRCPRCCSSEKAFKVNGTK